jgi:hypothetical protein
VNTAVGWQVLFQDIFYSSRLLWLAIKDFYGSLRERQLLMKRKRQGEKNTFFPTMTLCT